MTVENCIKHLEAYKKQSENPVNDSGQPLTGDQRKHAVARSKLNYNRMAMRIIGSRKFNGATIKLRTRSGRDDIYKKFEKHPIVDQLKEEFGLTKKPKKEVKEVGKKSKG